MTSSLVGSEMCIRDRPDLLHLGPREVFAIVRSAMPDQRSKKTSHWMCAVSYTHLTLPTICSV
eukprot:10093718-Prorocentrum_lima.AAC.1